MEVGHTSIAKSKFNDSGLLTAPIFGSRKIIGEIHVEYLLIRPFLHPTKSLRSNSGRIFHKPQEKLYIGHRGSGANDAKSKHHAPPAVQENTLQSFWAAYESGAHWIEFDVNITSDNVPVIFHDYSIHVYNNEDDTHPVSVPIPWLSLNQFKSISKQHKIRAEKAGLIADDFPTLEEMFANLPTALGFNIEVKYPTKEEISDSHPVQPRNFVIDTILKV